MQFNELGLSKPLLGAVERFGYTVPTPIQQATIPLGLSGDDILGCAQTGTGKTAAFALPILQRLAGSSRARTASRPLRALVLAPTRELAMQNYECFHTFGKCVGISSAVIFGGVSQNRQVDQLSRGVDVLCATPGRLLDLMGQGYIHLDDIEIFVLDEADRMLDMGFIHDVKRVISKLPSPRQTMLFSATMPPEVEELALTMLTDPETVKVDPVTSTVDKIRQTVYFIEREDKKAAFIELLKNNDIDSALVFVRTKSNADQIVRMLKRESIQALAIHGDKSQNAREKALNSFKAGEISVLVATDIASRGIDISELPFVINYNIPEEPQTYIHRIGRTGRAGLDGSAISLCASDELLDWWAIEKLIGLKVPVAQCTYSVENMRPTEKPKKLPRPPRSERAATTQQQSAKPKASAHEGGAAKQSAQRRTGSRTHSHRH